MGNSTRIKYLEAENTALKALVASLGDTLKESDATSFAMQQQNLALQKENDALRMESEKFSELASVTDRLTGMLSGVSRRAKLTSGFTAISDVTTGSDNEDLDEADQAIDPVNTLGSLLEELKYKDNRIAELLDSVAMLQSKTVRSKALEEQNETLHDGIEKLQREKRARNSINRLCSTKRG